MSSSGLPPSTIPIFTTVGSYREWRRRAFDERQTVGFVPTMGALHDGHLSLVKRSLLDNDLTVVSIFVNPAQFAPHEDLTTYPRTLPRDLELLTALSIPNLDRTASAVFLPTVQEMYPSGIDQDVTNQRGTFIEVKGYGHQMEGRVRPTFFRGVATVVTKLFNAIEPTNAYFGQKDIQQGLLLRRLSRDLLLSHPDPAHLHIIPTARDPKDGLALSSRNVYLSPLERQFAPTLYSALKEAQNAWSDGNDKSTCIRKAVERIEQKQREASGVGVEMKLDYVEMNHSDSFDVLEGEARQRSMGDHPIILSGAIWVGRTRLIDNVILGDEHTIVG
ncbi:hypothetical protein JAAARDRAFT_122909 [Jaapia argillacea MUCL 33604]|uniref:Pantoate--beta-alanine ligase n=1 Tax=Jaapia argillacea MUCL 33604 TaxID=933084 RepID=A0A067Q5S9_9AGAM|nr:hypothetical protein JAAARDRAFT_122909 [Jaapia argillacea MUCL 33604]